MEIPSNIKYSKDHEWVKKDGDFVIVGISDFAQKELGDIVYVEIENTDDNLSSGEIFGTVEAVKTVSDLIMPVSGQIVEINETLENEPEKVNNDPYNNGWMVKIKPSDKNEFEKLLDSDQYKSIIGL